MQDNHHKLSIITAHSKFENIKINATYCFNRISIYDILINI